MSSLTRVSRLSAGLAPLLCCVACAVTVTAQEAARAPAGTPPELGRPTDGEALRSAAFQLPSLKARRSALLESMPEGAVVIVAAGKGQGDIAPFRPSPDFLYLSGQQDAGLSLLLADGQDVLFAPAHNAMLERWNGPRMAVGTPAAAGSGFGEVVNRRERKERIEAALAKGGTLYLAGITSEELELEGVESQPAGPLLARLRQVKDAGEIGLLRRACDITAASLREAIASIRPGQYEYEVQGVIEYVFTRYGAQRPGFVSIVGSGPNSCVLHYSANRRRLGKDELVVMDVGAEFWGYTADVTRTVPTSGTFSKRQRQVYECVLAAQRAGIAAVRPGVTMRDVDRAARDVIQRAGFGKYFLHSTSHWLGLDVHDVGPTSRRLVPGMVLTVEPGIYISAEDLGVRIEDDVLVTETGCLVLSDGVPRDVEAIEAMMRSSRGVGARDVAPLPRRAEPPRKPGTRYFQVR